MIITVDELKKIPQYKGLEDDECIDVIVSIENLIRDYTHNNFQDTRIRFVSQSRDGCLIGIHPFLREGDTIQISQSVNAGIYTISGIDTALNRISLLNGNLFDVDCNLVTKVLYPAAVKSGVIKLLEWESTNRKKVGIKSETISRHSVTFYDQDSANTVMGYPVSLMAFLEPYMKPRY